MTITVTLSRGLTPICQTRVVVDSKLILASEGPMSLECALTPALRQAAMDLAGQIMRDREQAAVGGYCNPIALGGK